MNRRIRAIPAAILTLMALPSAAQGCGNEINEFALLASMDMRDEATQAYRKLARTCSAALAARASSSGAKLPRPEQRDRIVALGKQLYAARRDRQADTVGQSLAAADMPQVNTAALRGIGVENAAQAFGAMGLDIAAAGLQSGHRYSQAAQVRKLADQIRGNEPRAGGASGGGASGGGGGMDAGPAAPPQPQIPLPTQAIEHASCQGNLGFLEPQLRAYRDSTLSGLRALALASSAADAISQARTQGLSKPQAISLARQQAASDDESAAQAAMTANQSDAQGSVSVSQTVSDQLPLDFSCQGPAVHASAVCAFISFRWSSLIVRTITQLMERCWKT